MTLIELLMTHLFLYTLASLTRLMAVSLTAWGFQSIIAPSRPLRASSTAPGGYRAADKTATGWVRIRNWFVNRGGGIAGGGVFELDLKTAAQVAPLAIVFSVKLLLSNISFA